MEAREEVSLELTPLGERQVVVERVSDQHSPCGLGIELDRVSRRDGAADFEARGDGLEIVGIWHTHPDHPARPSETDSSAAWQGYTYLILSVGRQGVADVTAWRLVEGSFVEQLVEEVQA